MFPLLKRAYGRYFALSINLHSLTFAGCHVTKFETLRYYRCTILWNKELRTAVQFWSNFATFRKLYMVCMSTVSYVKICSTFLCFSRSIICCNTRNYGTQNFSGNNLLLTRFWEVQSIRVCHGGVNVKCQSIKQAHCQRKSGWKTWGRGEEEGAHWQQGTWHLLD